MTYPFIVSVPHGGREIPGEVADRVLLEASEVAFYSDPMTERIFDFHTKAAGYVEARVSRMIVDVNRPPYHLAPKYPDGAVKSVTSYGSPVYRDGRFPGIDIVHRLMVKHFFPYHEKVDRLTDKHRAEFAFDCHSMLPNAPPGIAGSGGPRPLICLGNNGDMNGDPRPGILSTCPGAVIRELAGCFKKEFGEEGEILINNPYSGGFVIISHHWHREVPWVQIEVNRGMYEDGALGPGNPGIVDPHAARELGKRVWDVLAEFWDGRDPRHP